MSHSTNPGSSSRSKATYEMTEPLALGERIYRSFPAPLMNLLLSKKGVRQPTAVIESVEGGTGIPGFEAKEFGELMDDMDSVSRQATKELEALVAKGQPKDGYSAHGK